MFRTVDIINVLQLLNARVINESEARILLDVDKQLAKKGKK